MTLKNSLLKNYEVVSDHYVCCIELMGRFHESEDANSYSSHVMGKCILVYEMDMLEKHNHSSVLKQLSSILWIDTTTNDIEANKVACIFLLEIKEDCRRKDFGTAFNEIQK